MIESRSALTRLAASIGGFRSRLHFDRIVDPTAECAKCNSTAVYALEDGGLVCGKCGARLAMELTEIAPG